MKRFEGRSGWSKGFAHHRTVCTPGQFEYGRGSIERCSPVRPMQIGGEARRRQTLRGVEIYQSDSAIPTGREMLALPILRRRARLTSRTQCALLWRPARRPTLQRLMKGPMQGLLGGTDSTAPIITYWRPDCIHWRGTTWNSKTPSNTSARKRPAGPLLKKRWQAIVRSRRPRTALHHPHHPPARRRRSRCDHHHAKLTTRVQSHTCRALACAESPEHKHEMVARVEEGDLLIANCRFQATKMNPSKRVIPLPERSNPIEALRKTCTASTRCGTLARNHRCAHIMGLCFGFRVFWIDYSRQPLEERLRGIFCSDMNRTIFCSHSFVSAVHWIRTTTITKGAPLLINKKQEAYQQYAIGKRTSQDE